MSEVDKLKEIIREKDVIIKEKNEQLSSSLTTLRLMNSSSEGKIVVHTHDKYYSLKQTYEDLVKEVNALKIKQIPILEHKIGRLKKRKSRCFFSKSTI